VNLSGRNNWRQPPSPRGRSAAGAVVDRDPLRNDLPVLLGLDLLLLLDDGPGHLLIVTQDGVKIDLRAIGHFEPPLGESQQIDSRNGIGGRARAKHSAATCRYSLERAAMGFRTESQNI
jgi:hypothetical protein